MSSKIFVNLPVQDLERAKNFYQRLGFSINEQFTDETAACVVISEEIYVMLLTHDKFRQFTSRTITDTKKETEVLLALSRESREAVDALTDNAIKGGGKMHHDTQDYGWMYSKSIEDPDGHIWEVMWMDQAQIAQQQTQQGEQA